MANPVINKITSGLTNNADRFEFDPKFISGTEKSYDKQKFNDVINNNNVLSFEVNVKDYGNNLLSGDLDRLKQLPNKAYDSP